MPGRGEPARYVIHVMPCWKARICLQSGLLELLERQIVDLEKEGAEEGGLVVITHRWDSDCWRGALILSLLKIGPELP